MGKHVIIYTSIKTLIVWHMEFSLRYAPKIWARLNNYLIGSAAGGVLKSVCLKVGTLRKSRSLPSRFFDRSSTCSGASASSGRAGHRLNIAG